MFLFICFSAVVKKITYTALGLISCLD